jgi:hypothetical protein
VQICNEYECKAYHQTAFKEELHTSYTNLIANGEGDPRIIMVRGDPRIIMVRGDPRIIMVRGTSELSW